MGTMTVLEFDDAEGASKLARALDDFQRRRLITVLDAAIVSWPEGAKRPKTDQFHNIVGASALSGAFWGFLFGLIFLVPLLGMAVGAGMGALTGALRDVGIDDDFIKMIRNDVTEGSSALFLLSADEVPDRLAEDLKDQGIRFKLVTSNLDRAQEDRLREVFGA